MNDVRTETIWQHQTTELPDAEPEHPHRRRILASFYAGCGVLGLVIGVAAAELSAAPPLIPPAAVSSHGVSGPVSSARGTLPASVSAAATKAGRPALKAATVTPAKPKSARAVTDPTATAEPTVTTEPTTEPTPTPSDEPVYAGPTATRTGMQGAPTATTIPPSESPRPPA